MIDFFTDDPDALLEALVEAVADSSIKTWTRDGDGDFTHSPSQWRDKAWMRPRVRSDRLRFNIVWNANVRGTKEIYGVFHGRFMEAMLTHFDEMFDKAEASALIEQGDASPPKPPT